jgi:hypothetical protein
MLKYVLITVIIIISYSFYGSCRALDSRFVFLNLIRHFWTSDISSQRPLPTQDNITYKHKTKYALSGIRTRDPSNPTAKTNALDRVAFGTG